MQLACIEFVVSGWPMERGRGAGGVDRCRGRGMRQGGGRVPEPWREGARGARRRAGRNFWRREPGRFDAGPFDGCAAARMLAW